MFLRSILAVLWTAFIFYALLSKPDEDIRFWLFNLPGVDKAVHFVLFGIEAVILKWYLIAINIRYPDLLVLSWCIILGGTTELLQHHYIEGRTGDHWDLLADTIGSFFALILWRRLKNN